MFPACLAPLPNERSIGSQRRARASGKKRRFMERITATGSMQDLWGKIPCQCASKLTSCPALTNYRLGGVSPVLSSPFSLP